MAENQSEEVDVTKELEKEYNAFLSWYDENIRRVTEAIGRLKGYWPVGQKRDIVTEVAPFLFDTAEAQLEWTRYLLDEIKRVRTRMLRKEIELADATRKTAKALRYIKNWMEKYEPTLDRIETDYQAALGGATRS